MERVRFGAAIGLTVVLAAVALSACTAREDAAVDLPDSATLQVPPDPAGAPQPVRADSVTPRAPSSRKEPPTPPPVAPVQPTRRQDDEPIRQPPPPRDTRPSIPWPPDTL